MIDVISYFDLFTNIYLYGEKIAMSEIQSINDVFSLSNFTSQITNCAPNYSGVKYFQIVYKKSPFQPNVFICK